MMSSIRGKNTKPEWTLRSRLFSMGFRYRLHVRELPGSPDLVFPRYHAVVFVHGCFWHRHEGCRYTTFPASNAEFWAAKFRKNMTRDARHVETLESSGWRVAIVWECALKYSTNQTVQNVAGWLLGNDRVLVEGDPIVDKEHPRN